jgi:3-phosphoshikimate 1-carboxyvinyltransferase
MAFTIAGLATEKSFIEGAESVDVSYPHFVNDLKGLGANIRFLKTS